MNLNTGSRLQGGRYVVAEVVSQEGLGITYLGEHTAVGCKVIIKELLVKGLCVRSGGDSLVAAGTADGKVLFASLRERFVKEAGRIAKLKHHNIVPIIDVFEENGTAYYVTEHVGGVRLSEIIDSDGAIDEKAAIRYINQVAMALEYLHSNMVLYLDVMPDNILVVDNDAVLTDFVLSRLYNSHEELASIKLDHLCHCYSPLEMYQVGGAGYFSPATDIFSLGATMYKVLTGKNPPTADELINNGLPSLPNEISEPARRTVEASMKLRRKDRPQDIRDFMSLLNDGNGSSGTVVAPVSGASDKTEIVSSSSDKTEIVSPSSDRTEIVSSSSDRTEIVSPSADNPGFSSHSGVRSGCDAEEIQTPAQPVRADNATSDKNQQKPKRSGSLKILIIVLMLLLVAAGVGAVYYFLVLKNESTSARTRKKPRVENRDKRGNEECDEGCPASDDCYGNGALPGDSLTAIAGDYFDVDSVAPSDPSSAACNQ